MRSKEPEIKNIRIHFVGKMDDLMEFLVAIIKSEVDKSSSL